MLWRFLCLIIFTIGFCGQLTSFVSNWDNETPLPDWIQFIDDSFSNSNMIYVQIVEEAIWEPGDTANGLGQRIGKTLTIQVDGVEIPDSEIFALGEFAPPTQVFDETGSLIGSHADIVHLYFTVNVPPGVHTATIQITSTSGVIHSYSWEFKFFGVASTNLP